MLSLRLLMSISTVSGFLCSSSTWSCPGSSLQHANRHLFLKLALGISHAWTALPHLGPHIQAQQQEACKFGVSR